MIKRDPGEALEAMKALDFLPSVPFPGADRKWPGVCTKCGQPGNPKFNNARRRGGACRYCKAVGANVDTAVAFGTMLAADFEPREPFTNANAPWRGECKRCGREGSPRLSTVKKNLATRTSLNACGYCSPSPNKVDMEHVYSTMAAAGFKPSVPYTTALTPWPGVCMACGNPGSPTYANVNARGGACLFCAEQRVDDAVAFGTMLARDFRPDGPYPGNSKQPWAGVCMKCDTPGSPTYGTARVGGVCRTCGTYGYKTREAGYLYLMERHGEQQVGITNEPDVRLARHKQGSWELLDLMGPMAGQHALDLETSVKKMIAARGIVAPGTRENWGTADLTVTTLAELLALSAPYLVRSSHQDS